MEITGRDNDKSLFERNRVFFFLILSFSRNSSVVFFYFQFVFYTLLRKSRRTKMISLKHPTRLEFAATYTTRRVFFPVPAQRQCVRVRAYECSAYYNAFEMVKGHIAGCAPATSITRARAHITMSRVCVCVLYTRRYRRAEQSRAVAAAAVLLSLFIIRGPPVFRAVGDHHGYRVTRTIVLGGLFHRPPPPPLWTRPHRGLQYAPRALRCCGVESNGPRVL